jgi:type IV pilus assembly protein PilW
MNISNFYNNKRAVGFTLLELLVAMSLGIFLMAGLIQVLLSNREVFRVQENSSRMQEDGRFATVVLNNAVSLTGYREDASLTMASQFPSYTTLANPPAQTFLAAEVVNGTDNDVGGGDNIKDGTDAIAIRYRSEGTVRDCLGIVVANGLMSVNRFYVDDDDTLNCRSDVYNPSTGVAVRTATQPLIDNVEDMQIRYGMSTGDVFHDVAAECYLDASVAIGNGADCTSLNFAQVVSARISLLLHSGDDDLTADNAAQTYSFEGVNVLAGDNRLYRAVTTTIAMRNKVL